MKKEKRKSPGSFNIATPALLKNEKKKPWFASDECSKLQSIMKCSVEIILHVSYFANRFHFVE